MKCDECQLIIEEFLDDELDADRSRGLALHLRSCAECASIEKSLRREADLYKAYERDLEVSSALWVGINRRISERHDVGFGGFWAKVRALNFGGARLSPAYVAILLLIAVGLSVAVTTYVNSRDRQTVAESVPPKPEVTPEPAPTVIPDIDKVPTVVPDVEPKRLAEPRIARKPEPSKPTPQQLIRDAESRYVSAIAILSRDFKNKRGSMEPEVVARVESVLKEIDSVIAETRSAYRKNPTDPAAVGYLMAAYSKKVDVLREVTLN